VNARISPKLPDFIIVYKYSPFSGKMQEKNAPFPNLFFTRIYTLLFRDISIKIQLYILPDTYY